MFKKLRTGIVLLAISVLPSLNGCGWSAGQTAPGNAGRMENADTVETNVSETDHAVIPLKSKNTMIDSGSSHNRYEYYLTKKELIADIKQGYIFRLDTALKKPYAPYVTQGNWSFYVHENNMVNLEIDFSNLLLKPKKNIFPIEEQIMVEILSPDKETVYRFKKSGNEITKDTSVQEQISVTKGEWTLRIGFGYYCGNTPACLKIAASYETPSKKDINWLKKERLSNQIPRCK